MGIKLKMIATGLTVSLLGMKNAFAAPNDYRKHFEEIFRLQMILSMIIIFAVLALTVFVLKKYHSGKAVKPSEISVVHNMKLEIAWTIIATIIVLYLFATALGPTEQFAFANNKQADVTILVTGHTFFWEFAIEGVDNSSFNSLNGTEIVPLVLESNVSYLLKITSADVIHSFYVPQLGFKADAVPGHFNYVYLDNIEPGEYRITCAEFCGAGHYNMPGLIIVR